MHEATLQTQIQRIVDEAVSKIHDLTRQWVISEVASTFGEAETKPKSPSSKKVSKKAKDSKPRRSLSPEAKANLMKNLRKAWKARSKQAAADRVAKEVKSPKKTATKKPTKRPTRKPAQKK